MLTRIRQFLATLWYWLTSPSYRLLQRSGLFDPGYYLENNPDVAALGLDPLAHYLFRGFTEPRKYVPLFDVSYYLHQYPELAETKENPLLHFLTNGRFSGLRPNPFYDLEYYTINHPDFDFSREDLLTHYLREGLKPGGPTSPSPYFDPSFYCRAYPDAAKFATSPPLAYKHFLTVGHAEKRRPSIFFDADWYLDKTPILREHGFDAVYHYLYLKIGACEKKSPSPLFDPAFYAKTYDIAECDDLFAHYLNHALQENRQPCSWFDPVFYRRTYLGGQKEVSLLQHFLEIGLRQGLYPNREIYDLTSKPIISVLVPVYNVEIAHLNTCIRSVVHQSYPHWELCLADDCSTDEEIRPVLENWASSDPRIKVVFLTKNSGISAATNGAADLATGSYLAFLDNDDELAPTALQTFAERINSDPADLYYSDEDLIGTDGRQFSVFRKPNFNGELLLCHNYVTHCVVSKKSLYEKVGGCAGELNGAQDLDLFLKLSEQADAIVHIPQVLYHWRASETSTSINHDEKHYADEAGRKSIAHALARRGISGEALFTDWKFFYRAKRCIVAESSVSLVINWQREEGEIFPWLHKLIATAGQKVRQLIIIMEKQSSPDLFDPFSSATGIDTVCRVMADTLGPAEKFHSIIADIKGELVAFVSGDLDLVSNSWLSALVEYGQTPEIGMVGGQIDYPGEYCDTVSPLPDYNVTSPLYYARFFTDCSVLMNGRHCPQEVVAISGDLFLIRRDLLIAKEGLDPAHFPFLFAFPDFSLGLYQQGKKNISTPYCQATFKAEGMTRRQQWPPAALQAERSHFQHKWFTLLYCGDPFYNRGIISDNGQSEDEFRTWLAEPSPMANNNSKSL